MLEEVGKRPGTCPEAAFSVSLISGGQPIQAFSAMNVAKPELASVADEYRAQIASSKLLMESVVETLTEVLAKVRKGDFGDLKDVVKKQSELATALGRAHETERKLNDWLQKQSGGLADGDIDFDAVRTEIRSRLDRLRAAAGAGSLS